MNKRRLFLIFSIFALMTTGAFAKGQGFLASEFTLGTGIPVYEDSSVSGRAPILGTSDYKRVVAGLSYNVLMNISEPIKIVFGADLMSDFLWEGDLYYHTLDYAFCTGIKVFPGSQGFNFGICYTLGNRTDFLNSDPENQITTKSWGNGFKLLIQYDFLNSSASKVKPLIGGYYRCIPRGSNLTDHTLCLYGGIKF